MRIKTKRLLANLHSAKITKRELEEMIGEVIDENNAEIVLDEEQARELLHVFTVREMLMMMPMETRIAVLSSPMYRVSSC